MGVTPQNMSSDPTETDPTSSSNQAAINVIDSLDMLILDDTE